MSLCVSLQEGGGAGRRGGDGRKKGEGPQCRVLRVQTPLRLACAGHKRDQTKEILGWEGLGGGLRSLHFHAGGRLHRLLCVNDVDRAQLISLTDVNKDRAKTHGAAPPTGSEQVELAVDQLLLRQLGEVVLAEGVPAGHVGGVAAHRAVAAALSRRRHTLRRHQGVSAVQTEDGGEGWATK